MCSRCSRYDEFRISSSHICCTSLKIVQVIIKVCETRVPHEQSIFVAALTSMTTYNSSNHPNVSKISSQIHFSFSDWNLFTFNCFIFLCFKVLSVIGVVSQAARPYVVLEYCAKGNLAQYLRASSGKGNCPPTFSSFLHHIPLSALVPDFPPFFIIAAQEKNRNSHCLSV